MAKTPPARRDIHPGPIRADRYRTRTAEEAIQIGGACCQLAGAAVALELHYRIPGRGIKLLAVGADGNIQSAADIAIAHAWFSQRSGRWRGGITDQIKAHRGVDRWWSW